MALTFNATTANTLAGALATAIGASATIEIRSGTKPVTPETAASGTLLATVAISGTRWTQTARTTGYFAGPGATPDGAAVLTAGQHATETRVSWAGGDTIAEASTPIVVGA